MKNHELLQFFEVDHMPPKLMIASEPFYAFAHMLATQLPDNCEKDACMRKLLEAKDCAVRSVLMLG